MITHTIPTSALTPEPIALDTIAAACKLHEGHGHDTDEDAGQAGTDQGTGPREHGDAHGADRVDPRVFPRA